MLLFHYGVVLRVLLYIAVLFLHVPTEYQKILRGRVTRALRKVQDIKESSKSTLTSMLSPHYPAESIEDLLNIGDDSKAHDLAERTLLHYVPTKNDLKGALTNLWKRVPDGLEIDHRRIAWNRQSMRKGK